MIFTETAIPGAFILELERWEDDRGFFARTFCRREFEAHGLNPAVVQCNVSHNRQRGTLRGMHYQAAPMAEAKLVHCVRGAIYDVIVDLRPESSAYGRWVSLELTDANGRMFYIPEGVAHGFQTLADDTLIHYQMSQFYSPEHAAGVRWDDPAFGIHWPLTEPILSPRDREYPDYLMETH